MLYIYDILLNFNKNYYEFFQWKSSDKIINVKKIPVFRINDDDLFSFKYYDVKVKQEFLNKIEGMSSFYSKNSIYNKYICLFSNTKETLGIMFDSSGRVIKRSSLVFDEEDEVNQELVNDDIMSVDFVEINKKKINFIPRIFNEKRDFLIKYINGLNVNNDLYILKYIYYDCFELEEDNVNIIREDIFRVIYDDSKLDKLYNLVNLLKKIKN